MPYQVAHASSYVRYCEHKKRITASPTASAFMGVLINEVHRLNQHIRSCVLKIEEGVRQLPGEMCAHQLRRAEQGGLAKDRQEVRQEDHAGARELPPEKS